MLNNSTYYTHSGKFPMKALVLSLTFGIITTLILSFVYAYALYWIPFIYVHFLLTLGYGSLIGIATTTGFSMGKGRNNKIASLLGLFIGLFAYYIAWGAYSYANLGFFLTSPFSIMALMSMGLQEGFWSMSGLTIKGGLLGFYWLSEAIMIIGSSWLLTYILSNSKVFCEKCNDWISESEDIYDFQTVNNYDELADNLRNNIHSQLVRVHEPNMNSISLHLSYCDKCNRLDCKHK